MKHELVHPRPSEHILIDPVPITKESFTEKQGLSFVKIIAGIGRRVRGDPHGLCGSIRRSRLGH